MKVLRYTKLIFPRAFFILVSIFSSISVYADPVEYPISATGFSGGGSLTGSFIGNDLNGDGGIVSFDNEVISFHVTFSGDTQFEDFEISFPDATTLPPEQFLLIFKVDSHPYFIGDDLNEYLSASNGIGLINQEPILQTCMGISGCDDADIKVIVKTSFIVGPERQSTSQELLSSIGSQAIVNIPALPVLGVVVLGLSLIFIKRRTLKV